MDGLQHWLLLGVVGVWPVSKSELEYIPCLGTLSKQHMTALLYVQDTWAIWTFGYTSMTSLIAVPECVVEGFDLV